MSDLDFFVARAKHSDPELNTTGKTERTESMVDDDDAFDSFSSFAKVEEGMITTRQRPLDSSLDHVLPKSVPAAAA
jgi:hypothetical protein